MKKYPLQKYIKVPTSKTYVKKIVLHWVMLKKGLETKGEFLIQKLESEMKILIENAHQKY